MEDILQQCAEEYLVTGIDLDCDEETLREQYDDLFEVVMAIRDKAINVGRPNEVVLEEFCRDIWSKIMETNG